MGSAAALRWATGIFLTLLGAQGLIQPQVANQGAFDGLALFAPTLESFLLVQALLRLGILLAGLSLIFVAVWPHYRRFAILAETAGFVVLAWWAVVLFVSSSVAAASFFTALAVGIAVTAYLEREPGQTWGQGRHAISLVMILAGLPIGVLMLAPFGPYRADVYRPVANQLPWLGATFLFGSLSLLVAELQRRALNAWSVLGRIGLATAWVAWIVVFLAPFNLWNLVPLYLGFSVMVLVEPFVGPRMERFEAKTLRTYTSAALVAAIALPIFVGMGIVSNLQEYDERQTEMEDQREQAMDIAAMLDMRLARMAALAGVLARNPGARDGIPVDVYTRQELLGAAILDAEGVPEWQVGLPLTLGDSAARLWTPGPDGSSVALETGPGSQGLLLVAQPIDGGSRAVVVATAGEVQAWISSEMTTRDAHVVLAERTGTVLLTVGARPVLVAGTEANTEPPLAFLQTGQPTPAVLAYTPGGEVLAGIAALTTVDWGVVSERSATAALAPGRGGRNVSFLVLISVLAFAAIVGLATAQVLITPLERLASGIRQVARGEGSTAFPSSSIREIASLTADFEDMQKQLAIREAEERAARADAEAAQRTAEEALHLRDVFLRTLAHDLRAPLVSLQWYVQILQRSMGSGRLEPAELTEGLQGISAAAAEVVAAVDELHDLTRLAAGAPLPLQREPVDLVALAQRTISLRPDSVSRRIEFESHAASLVVEADPARLARVIENLLDNAIKYSPPDQQVALSLDEEEAYGAMWATLRVRDHGIGIASAELPHIFDLYYRSDHHGSIAGEGLGLASVRYYVELHGGRVEVQSEQGAGSVFTVRLPFADTSEGSVSRSVVIDSR